MHRSNLDELLLEFVGLFSAQTQPLDHELWNRALKSLLRHKRAGGVKERTRMLPGSKFMTFVEAAPFMTSVKMIIRGLYWHHQFQTLGLDTPISASMIPPSGELPFVSSMTSVSVANGQFAYAFTVANDDPKASMWYLQFEETS